MSNDERYLAHKQQLDEIKQENERLLGRNTLAIAGGAFALSVTLIKDLYPDSLYWSRFFLVSSWVAFGACAFLQIYSDLVSSRAVELELQKSEDYFVNGDESARERSKPHDEKVKFINKWTPWLLALGFCCMITFTAANVLTEKKEGIEMQETQNLSSQSDSQRGVTMPKIPNKQSEKSVDKSESGKQPGKQESNRTKDK